MSDRRIYLDHNATSPLRRCARRALWSALRLDLANPSSAHRDGMRARALLDQARLDLARCVGARGDELLFTSGGTESNNLALHGVLASVNPPKRLVTTAMEHPSVIGFATHLAARGGDVVIVDPDHRGLVAAETIARAMGDGSALVSVQLANHETGSVQPICDIAARVHERRGILHVDAVQAFGKLPVNVTALGCDLLSITAHKIGGPVGIGALFVSHRLPDFEPLFRGGQQEAGRRAGTQSTVLAAAFAAAAREADQQRVDTASRHARLRERMRAGIEALIDDAVVLTPLDASTSNTLCIAFPGIDRESLLVNLDLLGIRASAGAACESGSLQPSPVLKSMQVPEVWSSSALRFSLGHDSSDDDVSGLLEGLRQALAKALRKAKVF